MELVPILSTIILVGTVATFILAVAAYILYKIRERRGRDETPSYRVAQPEPHVLVTPQPVEPAPTPVQPQTTAAEARPSRAGSLFWEYTDQGFVPVQPAPSTPVREPEESRRAPNGGPDWV